MKMDGLIYRRAMGGVVHQNGGIETGNYAGCAVPWGAFTTIPGIKRAMGGVLPKMAGLMKRGICKRGKQTSKHSWPG